MKQLEIGSTVYVKRLTNGKTEIFPLTVTGIEEGIHRLPNLITGDEIEDAYTKYITVSGDTFYHSDIGRTVFLTEEEANRCANTPIVQFVEKIHVLYDGENWTAQLHSEKYSLKVIANSPEEAFTRAVHTIRAYVCTF